MSLEKAKLLCLYSPAVVFLSVVTAVAKQGETSVCRQDTSVSTSGTLETFMYSIKLKVFLNCNPLYYRDFTKVMKAEVPTDMNWR